MKSSRRPVKVTPARGFALVIAITLMVLLTLIAVGFLSLSTVTLRTSTRSDALSVARANARLALAEAVAALQTHAGVDTRITANASIVDPNRNDAPPVLGVWRSWEGTNHEANGAFAGRPISPGNDYKSAKENRFVAWLTSASPTGAGARPSPNAPPDTRAGAGKVTLVGSGSNAGAANPATTQVHLQPTLVRAATGTNPSTVNGAFAWWVGGENQKARVPDPRQPVLPGTPDSPTDSVAGWAGLQKSHASADPSVFRLDTLLGGGGQVSATRPGSKLFTLNQVDLLQPTDAANNRRSRAFFHDLSAVSVGLLTNAATGGWKKDFSLLTEYWSAVPRSGLPFFQLAPGRSTAQSIPTTTSYRPANSLFYPWAGYRGNMSSPPIYEHGAVSSWANLQNWATLYKEMPSNPSITRLPASTSVSRSMSINASNPTNKFRFLHQVRVIPVIARVQWVFSHWTAPGGSGGTRQPAVLVTPVITMWNPYNVTIPMTRMDFFFPGCLPNAFRYTFGNGTTANTRWNTFGQASNPDVRPFGGMPRLRIDAPGGDLRPGETRVFSPNASASATPVENPGELVLEVGSRVTGGYFYRLTNDSGAAIDAATAQTIRTEVRFNSSYNDAGAPGVGIYVDMNFPDSSEESDKRHLVYRMIYDPALAERLYPQIRLDPVTPSDVPQPFLTTIFGARTASNTHLASNGMTQTSPLVNYTAMGGKDTVESTIMFDYPGTAHPVNSPFDYSFEPISGAGNPFMPNATGNQGFIITGFQNADGLSRCVLTEIPTRPVQSLAELQNWDLRYENPIPPYGLFHIGNSDPTPLIPADNVFVPGNASKGAEMLQYDDSYCANHLLFDDWFVSSIAPNTDSIGQPSGAQTAEKTYTDALRNGAPLPNRHYRPIGEDVAAAQAGNLSDLMRNINQNSQLPGSWQTIASRLEVEGMFNVNSTSVTAWRALLGHARNLKTPFLGAGGNVTLSGEEDFGVNRFSIAGDAEAQAGGFSGQFPEAAEFAGYRLLTEAALDRLAQEVVNQVRLRGPFLSLAEFVNRQLSSGNLALAGTLQAALNALAGQASLSPFEQLRALSKPVNPAVINDTATGYVFREAANGFNAYGLPGWTRQADILRPLAPILSVRDDTFIVRAYGDARDANGNVTARAVCEAVVRRTRDFVDPSDAADIVTAPTSPTNQTFGRRFQLISFRWLSDREV